MTWRPGPTTRPRNRTLAGTMAAGTPSTVALQPGWKASATTTTPAAGASISARRRLRPSAVSLPAAVSGGPATGSGLSTTAVVPGVVANSALTAAPGPSTTCTVVVKNTAGATRAISIGPRFSSRSQRTLAWPRFGEAPGTA